MSIGKYNNWDMVDPGELFSKAPTEKKEANPKLNMVKFLQASWCSPVAPDLSAEIVIYAPLLF